MTPLAALLVAFALEAGGAAPSVPLPDPTRPSDWLHAQEPVELQSSQTDWRLQAVKIAGGRRTAILNGVSVAEGGSIGAAVITEIRPSSVVIDEGGRRVIVSLLRHTIKKTSRP